MFRAKNVDYLLCLVEARLSPWALEKPTNAICLLWANRTTVLFKNRRLILMWIVNGMLKKNLRNLVGKFLVRRNKSMDPLVGPDLSVSVFV